MIRALTLLGVFVMNADAIGREMTAGTGGGVPSAVTAAFAGLLLAGKSRTLLMVLFGVGAVLLWRHASRAGGSPASLLLRRYVVLFLVFGLAHLAVFPGDILTHYALTGLVLLPLLPWLLAGRRWRPLALAAVALTLGSALDLLGADLSLDWPGPLHLVGDALGVFARNGPSTLAAFAVGAWLARRPELGGEAGDTAQPRLARRLTVTGAVASVAGTIVSTFVDPSSAAEAMHRPAWTVAAGTLATFVMLLGGALCYFGLAWWLVNRGRVSGRALARLAPLGRLTLTAYLASTAVFTLALKPFGEQITFSGYFAAGLALFVTFAALAPLWLRHFRLGPAEWLWRRLTYWQPLPFRRRPAR